MTSTNMSSISEKIHNPFLLSPVGKDYIWGGSRLRDNFGKAIPVTPLAETWECSTHPDGISRIASGIFSGQDLRQVLREHPEFLGTHPRSGNELPVLIKFIDAKNDLSVQVHPDDEYAALHENGSLGKTEMWYVMDAGKDASLVFGFREKVTQEQVRESVQNGTVEKYLNKVPVHRDDVFYVQAGTVHAIGAGTLIAEIQESSNITYRLYDYDRLDKYGKKRKLHLEKALEVADLDAAPEPRQPMRVLHYSRGCAREFLCRCRYFEVERMLVNTENIRKLVSFRTGSNSFQVLVCIGGCGELISENGERISFFKGDTVFIPADSGEQKIHGQAQFLKINC